MVKMTRCETCKKHYDARNDINKHYHETGMCKNTLINFEQVLGKKNDQDKIRMDLLPFDSLEEIAKVLTFGAKKYSPNNWKFVDNPIERYEAAMLRHISSYKNGEELDNETGLPHLAHAACCLLFLISFKTKKE